MSALPNYPLLYATIHDSRSKRRVQVHRQGPRSDAVNLILPARYHLMPTRRGLRYPLYPRIKTLRLLHFLPCASVTTRIRDDLPNPLVPIPIPLLPAPLTNAHILQQDHRSIRHTAGASQSAISSQDEKMRTRGSIRAGEACRPSERVTLRGPSS